MAAILGIFILALSTCWPANAQGPDYAKAGEPCAYDSAHSPVAPFCESGKYNCLVNKVSHKNGSTKLTGTCAPEGKLNYNNYCTFESVPFVVNTTGIEDDPSCQKCTCKAGNPGAQCVCSKERACLVASLSGAFKSSKCPTEQPWCLVDKTHTDPQKFSSGKCISPAVVANVCISAGPGWGPVFIKAGTSNVKAPGDLCSSCTCSSEGTFTNCKKIPGCKMCIAKDKKKAVGHQCHKCCKDVTNGYYHRECIRTCMAYSKSSR